MLRDCACGAHAPRRLTRLSAAVHLAESKARWMRRPVARLHRHRTGNASCCGRLEGANLVSPTRGVVWPPLRASALERGLRRSITISVWPSILSCLQPGWRGCHRPFSRTQNARRSRPRRPPAMSEASSLAHSSYSRRPMESSSQLVVLVRGSGCPVGAAQTGPGAVGIVAAPLIHRDRLGGRDLRQVSRMGRFRRCVSRTGAAAGGR